MDPLKDVPSPIEDNAQVEVQNNAHDSYWGQNDQHDGGNFDIGEDEDDDGDQPQEVVALLVAPLRRSTRERRPSTWYPSDEYVTLIEGGELESYTEAVKGEHKQQWINAMNKEMKSLHDNSTYELVKLPKGKRALKNRWVYQLKQKENTSLPQYKARLVVKGYNQKKGC